MNESDIRWRQRFSNFCLALSQLQKFIEKGELNEFEDQGLIQSFEYNFELAWNSMKDYYENQGETNMQGSKDVIRLAFKRGLITDGDVWMEMVSSRILTSHTYQEQTARQVISDIRNNYYHQFILLKDTFNKIISKGE